MRHILQGFTMHFAGVDYGEHTEEVTLPIPTPMMQEYRGGAMDLGMNMPMMAIEALEATIKMAGHSPEIMKRMALAPTDRSIITFRGGILTESSGIIEPHVCVMEGHINGGSRDTWQRGEKGGIEFVVNGIRYFKYEVADQIVHELQAYPPRRIVNGVDQLRPLNTALGYSG